MDKLIEHTQENFIVCDNPECDFVIPNNIIGTHLDDKDFIDQPCPKCGENLLTEEDYLDHLRLMKTIAWVNKWFSWITIFFPKKEKKSVSVKVHKGIKFEKDGDQ